MEAVQFGSTKIVLKDIKKKFHVILSMNMKCISSPSVKTIFLSVFGLSKKFEQRIIFIVTKDEIIVHLHVNIYCKK